MSICHFSLNRQTIFMNGYKVVDGETGEVIKEFPTGPTEVAVYPALCNQRRISGSTMSYTADWQEVTCEKCLRMKNSSNKKYRQVKPTIINIRSIYI